VARVLDIVRRILGIALILLVALVVGFGALLAVLTVRAFPTVNGTVAAAGLRDSVTVWRDAAGIVSIEAKTPHDLFFAQGYVHAQERMWQMEVWRHISAGRLSELFGKSTIAEDRFIRTLGWRQAAQRDLAALSPTARAVVDAYAEGVNAWLDQHRGGLGMPFVVTGLQAGLGGGIGGYDPEPWTPLDTMAWQKVQSWELGGNYDTEIFRMLADAKLGSARRTNELFPAYSPTMPVITPSGLKGSGGAGAAAAGGRTVATAETPDEATPGPDAIGDPAAWRDVAAIGERIARLAGLDAGSGIAGDHQLGSNNWVVAPSKSATKRALLANDPHLGISMPSVWFINTLRCRTISAACPYNVAGVSFPGGPGVILGHNDRIAWGATNVDPDVMDLFEEQPDPANPDRYLYKGASLPFTVRQEEIKVAGGASVHIEVRSTGHGPIVNDADPRLRDATMVALRWTGTDSVDGTFESFLKVNTASNFGEFHAAFEGYGSPAQNFVYADVDGHIGYVLPGRIPIRADPKDDGGRIRSGSDGKHDWKGFIPAKDLPWQLDPPSGVIVTANNAPVDSDYPYRLGAEWDPGYRAQRIANLLDQRSKSRGLTLEDFRQIQNDTAIPRADLIAPHLVIAQTATSDGAIIAANIADWRNRSSTTDSLGCAAYVTAEVELLRGVFDDELGDLAREYVGGSSSWQALISLLNQPDSPWWDDIRTPKRETQADILSRALDRAGADLRQALGDADNWTWGRLHTATFREATLGSSGIGPLEWYFDRGPVAVPGAAGAVDNTYYRPDRAYPDPYDPGYVPVGIGRLFEVTNLPSYRLAVDVGSWDGARIVQTTGQSGHPFDPHYGDLIDDWASGGTVSLPFGLTAISSGAVARLQLVPPSG
jgi:penicillin amidase